LGRFICPLVDLEIELITTQTMKIFYQKVSMESWHEVDGFRRFASLPFIQAADCQRYPSTGAPVLETLQQLPNTSESLTPMPKSTDLLGTIRTEQQELHPGRPLGGVECQDDSAFCDVMHLRGGMRIFVNTAEGRQLEMEVEPTDRIEDVRAKIDGKTGSDPGNQRLLFRGTSLEDGNTLQDYSIQEDSTLQIRLIICGGGGNAEPTHSVGAWFRDLYIRSGTLPMIALRSRYNRSTNVSCCHDQRLTAEERDTGSCYAHAASSAYLNTIARIFGSPDPPSFADVFRVADYSRGAGGQPAESIQRLESHFGRGILCDQMPNMQVPQIRDIIVLSVIVSFTTSEAGWTAIDAGSLLEKPPGSPNGWHATLVEGYDFRGSYVICKNSWGDRTATPRFKLRFEALHNFYCTRVFFTLESIRGKTTQQFNARMDRFTGRLNGTNISCAWMNELTATYCSEYICARVCRQEDDSLNYLGCEVHEWIAIMQRDGLGLKKPKSCCGNVCNIC
jgi:hypothetical protein